MENENSNPSSKPSLFSKIDGLIKQGIEFWTNPITDYEIDSSPDDEHVIGATTDTKNTPLEGEFIIGEPTNN